MSTSSEASADQPRLHWGSQVWRLLLCLLISSVAWSDAQWHDHRALFWIDLAGGLVAFGLVLMRRRWPFPIALALAALGAVSAAATGPAILAAVSMATHRRWLQVATVGLVSVSAWTIYTNTQPTRAFLTWSSSSDPQSTVHTAPSVLAIALDVVVIASALSWGMYIGSRRELLRTLRERAENAEAEQELRVSSARATERSRIAREMHDVVAHRISHVSMHAGAMAFRDDLKADELRAGAALIQTQANRALEELRSVLGVLRDPETGAALDGPQPTLADLDQLIAEARAAGTNIDIDDEVAGRADVPDTTGRTVYRIVQEGLTNARKHAPGALVRIRLRGSPDAGIDVEVLNPIGFDGIPGAPGAGLGLIGLAERVALAGGRLDHGRRGTDFSLRGWIPWSA